MYPNRQSCVQQRVYRHVKNSDSYVFFNPSSHDRRIGPTFVSPQAMDYTRFRQRRTGNQRMPSREEHRKAVCGNRGWQGYRHRR